MKVHIYWNKMVWNVCNIYGNYNIDKNQYHRWYSFDISCHHHNNNNDDDTQKHSKSLTLLT